MLTGIEAVDDVSLLSHVFVTRFPLSVQVGNASLKQDNEVQHPFRDFLMSLPNIWWFNMMMAAGATAFVAYKFHFDTLTALGVGLITGYITSLLSNRFR